MSEKMTFTWEGKPADELSREELVKIINWQEARYQREMAYLRASRLSWVRGALANSRASEKR